MSSSPDLAALEWERLVDYAAEQALTAPGREELYKLKDPSSWACELATARLAQQETSEAQAMLERNGLWGPLQDLGDPAHALERLRKAAILELDELRELRRWWWASDAWSQIPREEVSGERLKKALASLPDAYEPIRVLSKVMTPEGELSEGASPRFAQLSQEVRSLKREISVVLDSLLKTLAQKGVLQENFTDVRDGRYVLPIKIASQGDVDGIIYEASASRQTVFVEPREVAALNNRLRQRQNELLQETYLILKQTSDLIRPFGAELEQAVATLARWDAVQARARLGRRYSGKPIQVTSERSFLLRHTAHPLLWWSLPAEKIIRNDIHFAQPACTLLLSGPNTGGKTILLKTLGLAAACARTGLTFPASESPYVPLFDGVFTDVGDPQSIEAQLSTFSGHLLRFKGILERVTPGSLVLLDELNSATDPEEGAALGRSILEELMDSGAMVVTTTHDPHLKALSLNNPKILSASLAFDEGSRTPTYRMILGVPGRSRAIETAERLGLAPPVIARARGYLSTQHNLFERTLSRLEAETQEAEAARRDARRIRDEADLLKRDWTERTQTSLAEVIEKIRLRLRRVLEQAQDDVRTVVRKLEQARTRKDVEAVRGKLGEVIQQAESDIQAAVRLEAPDLADAIQPQAPQAPTPGTFARPEVGATVRVARWKSFGTILEIQRDKAKVAMGTLQVQLPLSDLEPVSASQLPEHLKAKARAMAKVEAIATPAAELDLRGRRLDEALREAEQYLDQAFRSGGLREVTIIHGLGTGSLREGIRGLIAKLPYVTEFTDAGPGHGGSGATRVTF